jgi:hypothetical protein
VSAVGRRSARPLATLFALLVAACSTETTIALPQLDLLIGSGDGQFGVVNTELPSPLRVVAQSSLTGLPRRGVSIQWDVMSGGAALIGLTTTVTDSTGSAEIRLRLGPGAGEVGVRARIADQPNVSVEFGLFGVAQPTLVGVAPPSITAGDTVTLSGTNFSPVADQNVVLFSGIRGRVLAATSTTLDVVVPRCLPARDVDVHMQLGVVASADTVSLTVTGGGVLTTMTIGEVIDVADDAGFACYALNGGIGVSYLTIVYSASSVGAARHPYQMTALRSFDPIPVSPGVGAGSGTGASGSPTEEDDPQGTWDEHIRGLEGELIRRRAADRETAFAPALVGPGAAPAAVPAVGERRTFSVLNSLNRFDQVGAVAHWVGTRAAIFVDTLAPAGGFTPAELGLFADRFDQAIHPQVTSVFGSASDLDANGRIVILFTPAVNRLTPRNAAGFIGGFFYGNDLLPTREGSNAGEVFYALVPDPTGIHSNSRSKANVTSVVPAILAHEFQHMVHFNERILVRGALSQEALWLSEALAQMAEEVVAQAYEGVDTFASDTLFRDGTRVRARRYLQGTDTVSLAVTTGQGSLPERGAGFLYLLYLDEQFGGNILGRLTRTMRTGVTNVEAESGRLWPDLVADWWSAVYRDQPGSGTGPLTYPDTDLRVFLRGPYPLVPRPAGLAALNVSGSLWSSSAAYYLVTPGGGASTTVRLGGGAGGPIAAEAILRMRIIRVS